MSARIGLIACDRVYRAETSAKYGSRTRGIGLPSRTFCVRGGEKAAEPRTKPVRCPEWESSRFGRALPLLHPMTRHPVAEVPRLSPRSTRPKQPQRSRCPRLSEGLFSSFPRRFESLGRGREDERVKDHRPHLAATQDLLEDSSVLERIFTKMAEIAPPVPALEDPVFRRASGHHCAIRTANITRALKFYSLLGLDEVSVSGARPLFPPPRPLPRACTSRACPCVPLRTRVFICRSVTSA